MFASNSIKSAENATIALSKINKCHMSRLVKKGCSQRLEEPQSCKQFPNTYSLSNPRPHFICRTRVCRIAVSLTSLAYAAHTSAPFRSEASTNNDVSNLHCRVQWVKL